MLTLLQLEMFLSPVLAASDGNGHESMKEKRKQVSQEANNTTTVEPKMLTALLQLTVCISTCALKFVLVQ